MGDTAQILFVMQQEAARKSVLSWRLLLYFGISDLVAWKCYEDTTRGVVAQKEKKYFCKNNLLLEFLENIYRTCFFSPHASKLDFKSDN